MQHFQEFARTDKANKMKLMVGKGADAVLIMTQGDCHMI